MIIYRVEHSDTGEGPYVNFRAGIDNLDVHNRPSPHGDGLSGFPRNWFFGYDSVSQLLTWWVRPDKTDWQRLKDNGFVIRVFEVADVRVGGTQVVFDKESATLISELILDEIEWAIAA